jgi:translocation and assembly module TamB
VRRALAALLSVVLTLVLVASGVVGWLLLTTSGARWLAGWATDLEPRLALTVEGGALASALELSELRWRTAGIDVSAARAELEWTPTCLLSSAVCLDRVTLSGLRIELRPTADDPASPQQTADIQLPLPIRLQLLQVTDARLVLPDVELAMRDLQASGGFDDGTLTLARLRLERLDVAAAQAESAAEKASAATTRRRPIVLPTVDLPLDLVVQNLLLDTVHLRIGGRQLFLRRLALSATLRGTRLDLERLQLVAQPLEIELSGSVTLAGDYPLSMRLSARAPLPDMPAPLRLQAALEGSGERLAVTADLQAPVAARAEATLRPLADGMPFELAARWQQIALPPGGEPVALLRDGQLQAAGDLSGYQGTLATAVAGAQVPAGRWRLRFAGDLEQLRVGRLEGETLAGTLSGEGMLHWRDGLRWQALLDAEGLNPGAHWPDYPGRVGGRLELHGQLDAGGLSFTATTPGIRGRLRGYPLALRGSVRKRVDDSWRFDRLRLVSGGNRLQVDGRLADGWALQGSFRLPHPHALLPELSGSASGRFSVRGALIEPDLTLDLQGSDLRYRDHALAGIELHADLRRLAVEQSRLRWTATGVRVGGRRVGRVSGQLVGDREAHQLTLSADGADYGGHLRLRGALDPQFNWVGRLLEAAIELPPRQQWSLAEPVALRWDQPQQQLTVGAHCWRRQAARLCLQEAASVGERGALQVALRDFRVDWLSPWLPEGVQWQATASGGAAIHWQPGMPPSARAELVSSGGRISLEREDDDPLELAYDRIGARLTVVQNELSASFELASQRLGSGRVTLQTRLEPSPRPLSGEVALQGLQLSLLRVFLPDVQTLVGAIGVRGRLGGTLQDPRLVGEVRLVDGELAAGNLPMTLTGIQLQADISGSSARLSGSFRSGDGTARVRGSADWAGRAWRLDLGVEGERLQLVYPPVARLQINPNLQIHVRPRQVTVEGRVVVPSGRITPRKLPEGAVAVSEDVVVIDREGAAAGQQGPVPVPAPGWSVTTKIELVLGRDVTIAGYGLQGRLAGSLRLRQRPQGTLEAVGELRIVDGRYEAYGQELEIRRGQLLFSGPVREPNVNIEAVRRAGEVVAGLRVEGVPEAPRVTLFSEPGLPQEQILSYLIRGRPLGEGGEGSGQELVAQAALSLGVFGGKDFANSLARELGIRDFELGTAGEGEETQVELSGYLTPDLLVRYGIGVFEPVNTLTLRYRINDRFFIEAVSGLERALDFFYEFEF